MKNIQALMKSDFKKKKEKKKKKNKDENAEEAESPVKSEKWL